MLNIDNDMYGYWKNAKNMKYFLLSQENFGINFRLIGSLELKLWTKQQAVLSFGQFMNMLKIRVEDDTNESYSRLLELSIDIKYTKFE